MAQARHRKGLGQKFCRQGVKILALAGASPIFRVALELGARRRAAEATLPPAAFFLGLARHEFWRALVSTPLEG